MSRKNRENSNDGSYVQVIPGDNAGVNSEEVVDAKKAAQEEKRKARNEAKERTRVYIKSLEDGQLKEDLNLLIGTGSRQSSGAPRASINNVLRDLFIEKTEVSEMDLFMQFKIGQPEMRIKIRIFVKTPNPDDRIWVIFDEEKEVYRMVGKGAEKPSEYTGFIPAEQNIL